MGSILSELPATRHPNAYFVRGYDRTVTRRSRLVLLAAATYGLTLVLIAAWPSHVDENINSLDAPPGTWLIDLGLPPNRAYELVEASANVILFIPFGALLMLGSLRMTWLRATAVVLMVSVGIELFQGVALPGRTASLRDVLNNTLGGIIGALGVVAWRRYARRRAARVRA